MARQFMLALAVALALGCTRSSQHKNTAPGRPTLQNAVGLKLVPAIDGGAYAIDPVDGGIWYFREDKAVRVSGLEGATISAVVPTVEGGLYMEVVDEGRSGLWYLKGTTIRKVEEKPLGSVAMLPIGPVPERWLWVLAQWKRLQNEEGQAK